MVFDDVPNILAANIPPPKKCVHLNKEIYKCIEIFTEFSFFEWIIPLIWLAYCSLQGKMFSKDH